MQLPQFDYHAPDTLEKALALKGNLGGMAPVLAGGTDLIVHLKQRLFSPAAVISLRNIKSLRGIETRADAIVIRAATPLAEIARDTSIQEHFPALVKAVNSIGATGIQAFRGTIGGNLCLQPRCILYNQSRFWRTGKGSCHRTGGKDCLALPGSESCHSVCSADTVPVLAAFSGQLTIAGSGGVRQIPVSDFFTGKGESPFKITPDEMVTEIRLPLPWAPASSAYHRLGMRSAVDFPLANAAATAIMQDGKVETFRLVISSAGPAPVVLKEAEALIRGNKPDGAMIDQVRLMARRMAEGVVVENSSISKDYRIKMLGVMTARAVKDVLGFAGPDR
ncbi:MAG TPA: FAD binding domain-containing protein [Desulfomonilaceae bacterium]|nr:FAD binding domain-containing protein [Desulfomonilaceae bacterium]